MNQRLLFFLFFSFSLTLSHSLFAQQENGIVDEKPVVLFVEFEFEAKDMSHALELLTEMQNQTLENEEGCMVYDILVGDEHPNTIFIYECYENNAAIKLHNNTPYFKNIVDKKLTPLIKSQKILTLSPLNDMGVLM
ncbi:MAG TPA: antibiotic biosynthesis monooxygenase [Dysgonamonadaceae bacterium]|nr:antibiotic biosynthesis monooxygenase [Dysgonamonadaceae bacterium]